MRPNFYTNLISQKLKSSDLELNEDDTFIDRNSF